MFDESHPQSRMDRLNSFKVNGDRRVGDGRPGVLKFIDR